MIKNKTIYQNNKNSNNKNSSKYLSKTLTNHQLINSNQYINHNHNQIIPY